MSQGKELRERSSHDCAMTVFWGCGCVTMSLSWGRERGSHCPPCEAEGKPQSLGCLGFCTWSGPGQWSGGQTSTVCGPQKRENLSLGTRFLLPVLLPVVSSFPSSRLQRRSEAAAWTAALWKYRKTAEFMNPRLTREAAVVSRGPVKTQHLLFQTDGVSLEVLHAVLLLLLRY